MEKYIQQLLEDIEVAHYNLPDTPDIGILYPDHPALEYGLDHIAEWKCAPYQPFEKLLGLTADQFPPIEKLRHDEIELLVEKLLQLWAAFNFHADFPNDLPNYLKYQLMINKLSEEVQYVSSGTIHFEFCDYDPQHCPYGIEYCQCKQLDDLSEID